MTEPKPKGLHAKLAEVVLEVGGVEKDGRNDFHKYDYTSAEAMLRAIRGPLASRGVVLMPSLNRIEERTVKTAKGGESTITTVWVTFMLVDSETGSSQACEWAGQGDDPADKGLGKAYTNAIKTFLREQFLIPQGDDPEADKKTDERAAGRVASPPKPQTNGETSLTPEQRKALYEAALLAGKSPEQWKLQMTALGVKNSSELTPAKAEKVMAWLA